MAKETKLPEGARLVVTNRRATFDYEIERTYEAGVALVGSEVKSMRDGKVEIVDAFAAIENGDAWLKQLYIAPFEQATAFGHEPRRARRLLLHAREIAEIDKDVKRGGYTLIPLRIYFKSGRVKIELALAKGRKKGDKRQVIARKEADREARAAIGRQRKGA